MSNFCGNSDSIKFIVVEPTQSITITGDTFVTGFTYSNGNLTILQNQGQLPLSVNLPIHNGNRWYIPSGITVTVTPGFQYFVYGDMYIDGTLELELDSQLVVLNGDLILSSTGTVIGLGTPYLITLPDTQISNVTYNNDVLTITETNGDIFTVTIPTFSGNTSGNCITDLYVSNLNSCSPLHIQPVNTGDVYISENGGNVGIGTSSPSELLDVNGKTKTTNFQMTSGATNGYVLSSDSLGNAMWIPGSSISGVTSVDTYVTGFTYDSSNNITILQNQGQPNLTITLPPYITGFTDYYVTGGTYSNGTLTLDRQDSSLTIFGFLTGTTDTFVTGFTFNNTTYDLTISQNEGQPNKTINLGILAQDVNVTGGTYNPSNGVATFYNNIGGSFNVSGFITGFTDIHLSAVTYNTSTGVLKLTETDGTQFSVSGLKFTGNTSGDCITDIYTSNIHSCSPLRINPLDEGDVYFGSTNGITIDLSNKRIGVGTSTPTARLHVKGSGTGYDKTLLVTDSATANQIMMFDNSELYFNYGTAYQTLKHTSGRWDFPNVVTVGGPTNTGVERFQIKGQSSDASSYAIQAVNSSNTVLLSVRNDGNVGIGTSTASEKLEVSGKIKTTNFQMTSGATNGYVLSSDSLGNAIWIPGSSISGVTDTFVTGFTFNNTTYDLTISQNENQPDKIVNLGILAQDVNVTGGTYNPSNGVATFYNNIGGSFNVSGFITGFTDTFVTGFTYSNNNLSIGQNQGKSPLTVNVSVMTGLTVNGGLTVTGNTSVKGITGTSAVFSGTGSNILTVIGSGTTSPIFKVQGSSGELFSITDSLTGSLFSVNDISGLPILEAFSDNTILMGSYLAPSLNTTTKVTANAGVTPIYYIPTSAYTGSFYDYTVMSSVGARSGNIMSIWSGTSVNYTETTTTSIGDTSGITFSVSLSGSTAMLSTSANTNSWTVKTIIRSI